MAGTAWNEQEIRAAILEYFKLLNAQLAGRQVNKSAIYTKLSTLFPKRSNKAFELKFQNISAILYEENLPYVDGLRPRSNYQLLLKLLVLNHLNRVDRPAISPKDILVRRLKSLWRKGYLPVKGQGSGRFGLTLEHNLNIPQNSSKDPDFMGIELKTKRGKSLQSLFANKPTEYVDCDDKRGLIEKHGYFDQKRNRQALYTSFNSNGDSLGFSLSANSNNIFAVRRGEKILRFDCDVIEEALLRKHTESAFITVSTRKTSSGETECRFEDMTYCKYPSMRKFLKLLDYGQINLDLTLSIKDNKIGDHGFIWKILPDSIPNLYLVSEPIPLGE